MYTFSGTSGLLSLMELKTIRHAAKQEMESCHRLSMVFGDLPFSIFSVPLKFVLYHLSATASQCADRSTVPGASSLHITHNTKR